MNRLRLGVCLKPGQCANGSDGTEPYGWSIDGAKPYRWSIDEDCRWLGGWAAWWAHHCRPMLRVIPNLVMVSSRSWNLHQICHQRHQNWSCIQNYRSITIFTLMIWWKMLHSCTWEEILWSMFTLLHIEVFHLTNVWGTPCQMKISKKIHVCFE